ncbi:MAG: 2-phospho-L-lactate guanylyltransferase [Candidatus Bathyarchaeia archaeon]
MSVFLIIPVKKLSDSKTRLSSILSPIERKALMLAMIKDVLKAAKSSKKIDNIILVSSDQNVFKISKEFNIEFLEERSQHGLNNALQNAIKYCIKKNSKSVLIIPADIPLVLAEDLEEIIGLSESSSIVITPSKNGCGTNALMLSPPNIIQPMYGNNSFYSHIYEAKIKGVETKVYKSYRLALDIDTPKDLKDFMSLKTNTYTYKFLSGLIMPKLYSIDSIKNGNNA